MGPAAARRPAGGGGAKLGSTTSIFINGTESGRPERAAGTRILKNVDIRLK